MSNNTRPNMFSGGTYSSLYTVSASSPVGSGREIDLREEMDCILFGTATSPRKGYPLVIRRLRRDSTGSPVACECQDTFSGECDPDCSYCLGESWLWDEGWTIGRAQYVGSDGGLGSRYRLFGGGEVRADVKLFFFRYDTPIDYGDKIIEMKLDEEGDPVVPYIRQAIYKPQTIDKPRSDHGRIEFIAVHCLEKDAIRSDTLR